MLDHVLNILDLLDRPDATGEAVAKHLRVIAPDLAVDVERVEGADGRTDFVKVVVPGAHGKTAGGDAPTLGVVGRHGGSGARPSRIGYVSDGDGAAATLAAAAKLASMHARGDRLDGDVILATHVCPDAPTRPHKPVEFMSSPVGMEIMNAHEVDAAMDAIVSIDTTKGNRIVNHRGIAITPTVMQGWVLPVADDALTIYERVCGIPAVVLPLSVQDVTPYGNGVFHVNSILQPATATQAPVIGIAITAASVVAGSATGASHETDIALAARYAVEWGKDLGRGRAALVDRDEFARLVDMYGDMQHLQTMGTGA